MTHNWLRTACTKIEMDFVDSIRNKKFNMPSRYFAESTKSKKNTELDWNIWLQYYKIDGFTFFFSTQNKHRNRILLLQKDLLILGQIVDPIQKCQMIFSISFSKCTIYIMIQAVFIIIKLELQSFFHK